MNCRFHLKTPSSLSIRVFLSKQAGKTIQLKHLIQGTFLRAIVSQKGHLQKDTLPIKMIKKHQLKLFYATTNSFLSSVTFSCSISLHLYNFIQPLGLFAKLSTLLFFVIKKNFFVKKTSI